MTTKYVRVNFTNGVIQVDANVPPFEAIALLEIAVHQTIGQGSKPLTLEQQAGEAPRVAVRAPGFNVRRADGN